MVWHARLLVLATCGMLSPATTQAADPLHKQVDALIAAKNKGKPASPQATDTEFLRRVYLDLAGRIPSVQEARTFLQDSSADKRAKLIDALLDGPGYARRMTEQFHVVLMERLGDHADWTSYLHAAFEKNKPWDQMAREMLSAAKDESSRGATFFLSKRLENYGQNPVDYPALTRDIGRLFLGKDLRCAQCHDHLFIEDYKQQDFQGLFAFIQNVSLAAPNQVGVVEKPTTRKVSFASVFAKVQKETGPRLPGMQEVPIPTFKPGDEFAVKPDPKTRTAGVPRFSTLAKLADEVTRPENPAFARNAVNRLWFQLMGRGLVHPLDLDHSGNPPSQPEVLDLLAREFAAHKYDIKWLLRELARTDVYQRSSVLPVGQLKRDPASFLTGLEKRLSAEQLLWSLLEATGEKDAVLGKGEVKKPNVALDSARAKVLKAFANGAREPEEDFVPALRSALFLLNDPLVLSWLQPRAGNLVDRMSKLADEKVAEELYLSVLTRLPTDEEKIEVAQYVRKNASRKPVAVGHLAWALLASTEFCVNH